MKLEKFLQDNYNYNPEVKDNIKTYIEQWKSWYAGNVKNFHNYFIYNGQRKVNKKRFTLNMAKEISEDWADILWSEKCEISLKNEESQKQFNELIDSLDLYTTITQAIEKSGALGTEVAVVSAYDIIKNEDGMTLDVSNAKTRVNLVDVDWIFPLSWDNTGITECAFGSVKYIGGQKYVVLSVHKLNDRGNYVIYNHLFSETNGNLTEVLGQEGTENEFDTQSNIKWFAPFKPLLTNNLFSDSPFGIPHYANAIDVMKTVDIDFDAFKNEVQDGRRRTFVRAELLNYDDGQQKLTFDPNDTDYYVLPKGASKDDLIQPDITDLRVDRQIEALNTSLNVLGNKVGFGENHYHFDGTNLSTATAVISSNSKMARRMKKLQIGYESAIYDLVKAICYVSSTFGVYNLNTDDMVIQFDDSIIEDVESESIRALREYNADLISAVEYRMRIFGESKEIAEKAIEKIKASEPTVDDLIPNNAEE
ncbi:MAG: phage portal protein [Cytophagales bacterium]|nr:phage portal protein [Cytophagales bacterium]